MFARNLRKPRTAEPALAANSLASLGMRSPPCPGSGSPAPLVPAGRNIHNLLMLLACPNLGPSRLLRCYYSPPSCGGNRSLLASRSRLGAVYVDLPEGRQSRRYAVQFIRKSHAFLLELAHYGLHQCFAHEVMVSLEIWTLRRFLPEGFPNCRRITISPI